MLKAKNLYPELKAEMTQYISELPAPWQKGWKLIAVCRARGLITLSKMLSDVYKNTEKSSFYYRRAAELVLYAPEN